LDRITANNLRSIVTMRKTVFFGTLTALFVSLWCSSCESKLDDNPQDLPLLGAAPEIVITPRDQGLLAQWTKVAVAQGETPFYEVYYGTDPDVARASKWGDVFSDTTNLVKATIEPLTNHQIYYVWIKSVFGEIGASDFSPAASGIPVPPPVTPGSITVTPGENMLDLKWPPVNDAFTYKVFYKQNGGAGGAPPADATVETVSGAGAIISGLTNGASYTVWVQAENTAGKSPNFSRSTGTPALGGTPGTAPVIKTVTPGVEKLILTWDQVPGVPRYTIFYNTADNSAGAVAFPEPIPADAPTVTAELTELAGNRTYYVWVKSTNTAGSSPFSAGKNGTTKERVPLNVSSSSLVLGQSAGEFINAQDVPPSVFFPDGRPGTDRLTRVQETAMGDMITDAMAWYVRRVLREEIDFAFLNGGAVEGRIPQGTITLGTFMGSLQADARTQDKLCLLTLTGAQLKEFFGVTSGDTPVPNSVAAVTHMGRGGHDTGHFGMVSKEIRYTIEYPKPPALGSGQALEFDEGDPYWHGRIKAGTLKLNGEDIVDDRNYRICTTTHVAGGEYYTILNTQGANKVTINKVFGHAVAEYIYDKQIITPRLDGRIKLEGGVPLPPPWVNSSWNPYGN
jgi:hypothetical protein